MSEIFSKLCVFYFFVIKFRQKVKREREKEIKGEREREIDRQDYVC